MAMVLMALKNAEYWRRRSEEIIEHNLNITEEELAIKLHGHYAEALQSINADIEKWLYRLANNNEISMSEARKWLKKDELDEFKYDIDTYVRLGREQNAHFDEAIAKQLENASARVHISRLEEIKTRMLMHVETLYGKQEDLTRIAGVRMITNTHKSLVGEFEGIVPFIDEAKALQMISEPWAKDGSDFSDKIWKNKHGLMNNIDKDITQGVIRGDNYGKLTSKMAKELNASEGAAGRLIMTESTAFSSLAQIETYKGLDVEEVEIIETIDSHTCDECSSLNGTVIKVSDMDVGITIPPFHPWCRGTTCPHNKEWEEE